MESRGRKFFVSPKGASAPYWGPLSKVNKKNSLFPVFKQKYFFDFMLKPKENRQYVLSKTRVIFLKSTLFVLRILQHLAQDHYLVNISLHITCSLFLWCYNRYLQPGNFIKKWAPSSLTLTWKAWSCGGLHKFTSPSWLHVPSTLYT